jgi:hypothetical protein
MIDAPLGGAGVRQSRQRQACGIDLPPGKFLANRPFTHYNLYSKDIHYFRSFDLVECARKRFETLPANSSEANLLLNSATSAAKTYRLFAIKCVRSHPRFS